MELQYPARPTAREENDEKEEEEDDEEDDQEDDEEEDEDDPVHPTLHQAEENYQNLSIFQILEQKFWGIFFNLLRLQSIDRCSF
ncbi:uncharacterized protein V6R79_012321 [Siganus canaliculatus]